MEMRLTFAVVALLSLLTLYTHAERGHKQSPPGVMVLSGSPIPLCPHVTCPPPGM